MILKKSEILKEINAGRLIIEPFDIASVKEASIELALGSEFGEFAKLPNVSIIDPNNPPSSTVFPLNLPTKPYELNSNWCVVGKTMEKITLPLDICGWITPRARTAIYKTSLDISSGFVQPGTSNESLFFLITNVGRVSVKLQAGMRIIQLILMRL